MIDFYYHLQIKALLAFKPAVLFDKINHLPWYRETLQQWTDDLQLDSGASILEAGCSTGLLSDYLYQQGFSMVGTDKSPAMISKAKANFPHLSFEEASIHALPYADSHFHAVIAASLINIVPDKEKAMQEIVRVCKVGGQVSIFTPLQGFTPTDLDTLIQALKVNKFSKAAMQAWYQLPPKMSKNDVSILFKQAGLSAPSCTTYLNGMVAAFTAIKR